MSTIKSSAEHLTLNADGASKDIKFQANGVEKASISSAGLFTSTTIDATKLTGNLPAISGASLTGLPAGGKVLQVVFVPITTTVSTSSSTFQSMSETASITPDSTNSRILIDISIHSHISNHSTDGWSAINYKVLRGSTEVSGSDGAHYGYARNTRSDDDREMQYISRQFIDSPNTTSSTTYSVQVNSRFGFSTSFNEYGVSSIRLMEIGA